MEVIYPVAEKKAIHPIAIFKEGFLLWVRNFFALSSIYLILHLPIIALQIVFPNPRICGLKPGLGGSSQGDIFIFLLGLVLSDWIPFFCLALSSWTFIALSIAMNKAADGQACRVMENIKAAGRRFFSYLGTGIILTASGLLLGLIILLSIRGTTALISWRIMKRFSGGETIPLFLRIAKLILPSFVVIIGVCVGVYFAIRLSLAIVVSIVEEQGPVAALKRSHRLTKNYVTPVVGEYCLLISLFIIFLVLLMPSLGLFLSFPAKDAKLFYPGVIVWWYLLSAALTPLSVGILVVLYKKLKETVDIKPVTGNQLPEIG